MEERGYLNLTALIRLDRKTKRKPPALGRDAVVAWLGFSCVHSFIGLEASPPRDAATTGSLHGFRTLHGDLASGWGFPEPSVLRHGHQIHAASKFFQLLRP